MDRERERERWETECKRERKKAYPKFPNLATISRISLLASYMLPNLSHLTASLLTTGTEMSKKKGNRL